MPLLDNVSFQVDTQAHTAIIGHTGAGKSTLLACILGDKIKLAGLQLSGRIDYKKHNLMTTTTGNEHLWLEGGICWIPQEPETAFNPTRIVKVQLLELICTRLNNSLATAESLLKANFKQADQLALFDALGRFPAQFSGGELQRILILHALVGSPTLVVADEPSSALDKENRQLIMSLLMHLIAATGATLLMSSHDYDSVRQYCKRFICLDSGKLIESGPVSQLDNRLTDNALTSLLHDHDHLQQRPEKTSEY